MRAPADRGAAEGVEDGWPDVALGIVHRVVRLASPDVGIGVEPRLERQFPVGIAAGRAALVHDAPGLQENHAQAQGRDAPGEGQAGGPSADDDDVGGFAHAPALSSGTAMSTQPSPFFI